MAFDLFDAFGGAREETRRSFLAHAAALRTPFLSKACAMRHPVADIALQLRIRLCRHP